MASSGKRKTTMAKLNRERGLLERRALKQARKNARKLAAAEEGRVGPELGPPASAADEDDLPQADLP